MNPTLTMNAQTTMNRPHARNGSSSVLSRAMALFAGLALLATGDASAADDPRSDRPSDPRADTSDPVIAFVDVTVLPMDGEADELDGHTVLVRDDQVTDVGPHDEVEIPSDARVIEGEGRRLLPGLAEMHAHIPANASDEAVEDLFFLYLANGVTTIRGMLGAPSHLELRDATASGELLGPTIFAASPALSGQAAPDPDAAEEAVRQYATDGYDLLKLHPGIERPVYERIAEVAQEEGITWAGHVSPDVGLEHSLATGKSTVDHLDGYVEAAASEDIRRRMVDGEAVPLAEVLESVTDERIRELARATAEAGMWNVPTAHLWETFYNDTPSEELRERWEMRYASDDQLSQWSQQNDGRFFVNLLEGWRTRGELGADDVPPEDAQALIETRRRVLAALHEEGAGILLGTDSPQVFMVPGFGVHREMETMTKVGMSPRAILESGTRNVAEYVRQDLDGDGDFGTVTAGARADLILVEGDPLTNLEALQDPEGVMVQGQWLPGDEIRERLEEISEG